MPSERQPVRFGLFEVNLDTGDVRRAGVKVRMQEQPFQVLAALLEKPGEIVTKEELQERIWKDDTFVDFDRSLATAINKVRQALGDSATRPRFIETVAKRGYRFIGAAGQFGAAAEEPGDGLPPGEVGIRRSKLIALQVLAAVLGIALFTVLAFRSNEGSPKQPVRRFSFVPPPGLNTDPISAGLAISPNGKHIAFTTTGTDSSLWVQDLDQDEPRRLAGTEGAILPFWSPDSEYIVFGAGLELRKISVQGGASGLLCKLPGRFFVQGVWSPDGESIVFASTGGSAQAIFEVSSQGGSPEELIVPADVGETAGFVAHPAFVSATNGRVLVFMVGSGANATMYAKNLDTGQTAALGRGDRPIYSASTGHLIYQSESGVYDLWARPFSPEALAFTGPAFSLRRNASQPSVSEDGTLAYLDAASYTGGQTLVWRDRSGAVLETFGQPQPTIYNIALSPDGRRVAVASPEGGNAGIWVHDLVRSTKTRLTFDEGPEWLPTWSPSGQQIIYQLQGAGGSSLMRKAADGTGEAVVLVEAKGNRLQNPDWSRDGRFLVYHQNNAEREGDIRYVELETDGSASEPITFLATPASEQAPKLSPDGRFVAYRSDESGRDEIYVRPFPAGDGKWQASVEGGSQPRWSRDGRELYYVQGNTVLMSVSISTGQGVALGQPQQLFQSDDLRHDFPAPTYDVSADGQRFVTTAPVDQGEEEAPPKIRIVENWYEEFRNREQ